jgi:hypothetical protein
MPQKSSHHPTSELQCIARPAHQVWQFNGSCLPFKQEEAAATQAGVDIETVKGLRGVVAAQDFEKGQILASVPYNCTIELAFPEKALASVTAPVFL